MSGANYTCKHKHWRASQTGFDLRAAPVLAFQFHIGNSASELHRRTFVFIGGSRNFVISTETPTGVPNGS